MMQSHSKKKPRLFTCTSLFGIGLFLGMSGLTENSFSASFNVNPIMFNLTSQRPSSVLKITNTGDDAVRLQVSSVDWQTDGHQELLQETNPLLLNPPIFSIPPGQTQYVRFGVRSQSDQKNDKGNADGDGKQAGSDNEKAYRLLVEEVPNPQSTPGLKTLLRVSIPVFIAPNNNHENKQGKLNWRLLKNKNGLVLSALNNGNIHTKITQIKIVSRDASHNSATSEKDNVVMSTPAYVLPGQNKEWPIKTLNTTTDKQNIAGKKVHLLVQTDKGDVEENLTLETQ